MADSELFAGIEPTWRVAVSAELLRIEEICSHAARAQSETVKIWRVVGLWLGSCAVLSAGFSGALVLADDRHPIVAGSLALAAALLTTVVSIVGPARKESQAVEAAKAYQSVETAARQARQVDLPGQAFAHARQALGELTESWHTTIRAARPVSGWAQRRAERGNTYTELPEEIMAERMSDIVRVFQVPRATAEQVS
jgi:hypothetical protein